MEAFTTVRQYKRVAPTALLSVDQVFEDCAKPESFASESASALGRERSRRRG